MDSDLNSVKPVDVSGGITPTTGADKKREQKQKQRRKGEFKREVEQNQTQDLAQEHRDEEHLIDYRA